MPMPDTAELLAELPEARASGEIRRIYGEIRRWSAVPMVALIYRHLATMPGVLEWAWSVIRPAMESGELPQRAWQLAAKVAIPRVATIPRAALRSVGIQAGDEDAIAAVLDAYNRANPVNILAVRCLAQHLRNEAPAASVLPPGPAWLPPLEPAPLPMMVNPAAMSAELRSLVLLLTDRDDGRAPSPLWPSLYRHLGHWPAMLAFAAVLVPPQFAAIDGSAAGLRGQVEDAAAEMSCSMAPAPSLPLPDAAERAKLLLAIERFSVRIPEMVVIGGLLRRALPAGAPRAPGAP
jgi:hypothetical protein